MALQGCIHCSKQVSFERNHPVINALPMRSRCIVNQYVDSTKLRFCEGHPIADLFFLPDIGPEESRTAPLRSITRTVALPPASLYRRRLLRLPCWRTELKLIVHNHSPQLR